MQEGVEGLMHHIRCVWWLRDRRRS
jgi:hypothetical protein